MFTYHHQYIDRATGKICTERLYGKRAVKLLYSRAREHAPSLFRILISARGSKWLGFFNYDLSLNTRISGGRRVLESMKIDSEECINGRADLNTMKNIFERKIKYWECRPMPDFPGAIVSPSDSRVIVGSFCDMSRLFLKDKFFEYEELLRNDKREWLKALMIGKIVQCYSTDGYDSPSRIKPGMFLGKGVPKSLYRPGSSTNVLIFQKSRMRFAEDLIQNTLRRDVESRFSKGFKTLPGERWQIIASLPIARDSHGLWRGVNLTFYGLLTANAYVIAVTILFILLCSINTPLAGIFAVIVTILLICVPTWRFVSEFFRADFRGFGKITKYQIMAIISIIYSLGISYFWPVHLFTAPDAAIGIAALWNPAVILFLFGLWCAIFLYTGRSAVTGSTLTFHVNKERI